MERRFTQAANLTVETREDGTARIGGYAAVYYDASDPGTEYNMLPDLVERIDRGAFERAIKDQHDVRALFNHDPSMILGRSKSGTLRLTTDDKGLRYEVDMPNTQLAKDLAESIRRGDVSGSSFAFRAKTVKWTQDEKRKIDVRTLADVDLLDVSPVSYPAYEAASVGMRSEGDEEILRARDEWHKQMRAVQVRARLVEIVQ